MGAFSVHWVIENNKVAPGDDYFLQIVNRKFKSGSVHRYSAVCTKLSGFPQPHVENNISVC